MDETLPLICRVLSTIPRLLLIGCALGVFTIFSNMASSSGGDDHDAKIKAGGSAHDINNCIHRQQKYEIFKEEEVKLKRMRLWPRRRLFEERRPGDTIYGFDTAISHVWKSQHPHDCSKAKFLVSGAWPNGFGSMIHMHGVYLAIAMNTGRVLLEHPESAKYLNGQGFYSSAFCKAQNKTTTECYFEPWSSCNIYDVIPGLASNLSLLENVPYLNTSLLHLNSGISNETVIRLHLRLFFGYQEIHPHVLDPVLECAPWVRFNYSLSRINFLNFEWWMAVNTAFMIRPNEATIQELARLNIVNPTKDGPCIGIYVRHGDKYAEMKLVPTSFYLQAADYLNEHETVLVNSRNINFGSEDPAALAEAISWSRNNSWNISFHSVVDRTRGFSDNVNYLYLSILLTLEHSLQCDAFVCTSASNYCRVVNELRSTVMRKADRRAIDLNSKICQENISTCLPERYSVRNNSAAHYFATRRPIDFEVYRGTEIYN